jgi:hypothetical protein
MNLETEFPIPVCELAATTAPTTTAATTTTTPNTGEEVNAGIKLECTQPQVNTGVTETSAATNGSGPIRSYFSCKYCPKSFASQSNRIRHEKTAHSSQFPLQMCNCGASFITLGTLQRHRLVCKLQSYKATTSVSSSVVARESNSRVPAAVSDSAFHHPTVTIPPISNAAPSYVTGLSISPLLSPLPTTVRDLPPDTVSDDDASTSDSELPNEKEEAAFAKDPSWINENSSTSSTSSDSEEECDSDSDNDVVANTMKRKSHGKKTNKSKESNVPSPNSWCVKDNDFHRICGTFLEWLAQPPCSSIETAVKTRRVVTDAQTHPVKYNLKYIINAVVTSEPAMNIDTLTLLRFQELPVCKVVVSVMEKKRVGAARLHTVLLLIKKVLVFLCYTESEEKKQYLTPNIYSSYQYVASLCSEASQRRKRDARDRSTLGIAPSSFFENTAARIAGSTEQDEPSSTTIKMVPTMTKDQLSTITSRCLATLNQLMLKPLSNYTRERTLAHALSRQFARLLVTSLLCPGLAPRSQVLKKLQIGTSLSMERGQYWMKLASKDSKNSRPVLVPIAKELTRPISFYVETVRPNLVRGKHNQYMFLKRSGDGPREEFSFFTRPITQDFVGVAFNAHAFRAGVITTFWQSGATEADMVALAHTMAHDHTTARNYYFKPKLEDASLFANDRMSRILLSPRVIDAVSEPPAPGPGPSARRHASSISPPNPLMFVSHPSWSGCATHTHPDAMNVEEVLSVSASLPPTPVMSSPSPNVPSPTASDSPSTALSFIAESYSDDSDDLNVLECDDAPSTSVFGLKLPVWINAS